MGQYAGARTLLVGDIDRGGVYASFIGHLVVMEPWERQQLAGFLINRFRGDISLLDDAHRYMLDHTGKPVLGVVPFLSNLAIPEEDSVSFKAGLFNVGQEKPDQPHVRIAVIDLPHISNFTDIEPFLDEEDVFVRIVCSGDEIEDMDAIILPGSKNVLSDLEFLYSSGIVEKIMVAAGQGKEIVGICGGFQMLGNSVYDPHGVEVQAGKKLPCLQLLSMETTLAAGKTLTSKSGIHLLSAKKVSGYEIHHGISTVNGKPVLSFEDGSGCGMAQGRVWGSYLHGIFDSDDFRRWWINRLRKDRGFVPLAHGAVYDLEPALDRLADTVRASVDMDHIYQLLDL
jgi:adenosylcobyric acid synthase